MTVAAMSSVRPRLVIPALGIVQILNWGSTYYLLGVLGRQIVEATGWSYAVVIGGLSLGLGVAGLGSVRVGRLIERHGGRPVLTAASLTMALGLGLLAVAPNVPWYLVAWVVIGFAMSAGLYDAAFSTLGRLYGQEARRAISTLTLWSGFASTICWPLSAFLFAHLGWRGTCFAYAGLQLVVCIPLIRYCIPDALEVKTGAGSQPVAATFFEPQALDHRASTLVLLSVILTLGGVVFALVSVHLITMLQAGGVSYATAVGLGTLIGPAQVFSRVLERLFGAAMHPIWTMMMAGSLILVGLALLWAGVGLPAVAIVAYGAGAGIWSIARGTLPLALFGSQGYPSLMGKLATPTLIAQALAPSVGAGLLDSFGVQATQGILVSSATLCLAGIVALRVLARRSIGRMG